MTRAVVRGDWKKARGIALAVSGRGQHAAVPAFVADVASDVLDDKGTQLSQYEYPYSDQSAWKEIERYTAGLLQDHEDNPSALLLRAMVYNPKLFAEPQKCLEYLERAHARPARLVRAREPGSIVRGSGQIPVGGRDPREGG